MNCKALLVLWLVTQGLSGCVTGDMPYTTRVRWDERIGVLTFYQAAKTYGVPVEQHVLPDGNFQARWHLKNIDFADQMQPYAGWDYMVLTFDRQGVLRNWETYR